MHAEATWAFDFRGVREDGPLELADVATAAAGWPATPLWTIEPVWDEPYEVSVWVGKFGRYAVADGNDAGSREDGGGSVGDVNGGRRGGAVEDVVDGAFNEVVPMSPEVDAGGCWGGEGGLDIGGEGYVIVPVAVVEISQSDLRFTPSFDQAELSRRDSRSTQRSVLIAPSNHLAFGSRSVDPVTTIVLNPHCLFHVRSQRWSGWFVEGGHVYHKAMRLERSSQVPWAWKWSQIAWSEIGTSYLVTLDGWETWQSRTYGMIPMGKADKGE
jgi:hypothetical protein